MKFGIRNTSFVHPNGTRNIWEDAKAYIQRAEKDGFDSFWVMDHFYQLPVSLLSRAMRVIYRDRQRNL